MASDEVVMRSSRGRARYTEEASLSPDLMEEEGPPPPSTDSIAFMITQTKVQALSTGEYRELVSTKGGEVQTVKVGTDQTLCTPEECGYNRKPVIIIFDEPMEIRQAYKRLSTIFEGEEELERMLSEDRIEEETEDDEDEVEGRAGKQDKSNEVAVGEKAVGVNRANRSLASPKSHRPLSKVSKPLSPLEPLSPDLDNGSKTEVNANDPKQDAKKKFKFKFPKKQLAAIGQALRTGTKTGKKTLQVVVYEDEEESDGTLRETKRFEIQGKNKSNQTSSIPTVTSIPKAAPQTGTKRTEEIRKNTFKTLDSLEETIKELESTITDMGPRSPTGTAPPEGPSSPRGGSKVKRSVSDCSQAEGSPSKRAAANEPRALKSSSLRSKKGKPHLPPRPTANTSAVTTAVAPSSSSSASSSSSSSTNGNSKQVSPQLLSHPIPKPPL